MKFKNILLIGGTHGNERTGVDLVNLLKKRPIKFITPLIANPKAVEKNVRYTETDLNRSTGKQIAVSYEEQVANSLEVQIKNSELIVEFHNTTSLNNTCAIITQKPNSLHKALANHFEVDKVLIMPAAGSLSGLNSKKFFSLEISNYDSKFTDIEFLHAKLEQIISIDSKKSRNPKFYTHTGITISMATLQRLTISTDELQNFQSFPDEVANKLALPKDKDYSPAFIGEEAYGKNFGFIVLEKL